MFVDMTDMVLVGLCCVCWYDWTWCWWVCVVFVGMTGHGVGGPVLCLLI